MKVTNKLQTKATAALEEQVKAELDADKKDKPLDELLTEEK